MVAASIKIHLLVDHVILLVDHVILTLDSLLRATG